MAGKCCAERLWKSHGLLTIVPSDHGSGQLWNDWHSTMTLTSVAWCRHGNSILMSVCHQSLMNSSRGQRVNVMQHWPLLEALIYVGMWPVSEYLDGTIESIWAINSLYSDEFTRLQRSWLWNGHWLGEWMTCQLCSVQNLYANETWFIKYCNL